MAPFTFGPFGPTPVYLGPNPLLEWAKPRGSSQAVFRTSWGMSSMRSFAATALVVIALVVPGIAWAKPSVTLKLTGSVVTKAVDGHTTLTPVEKVTLKPGDEVE